MHAVVPYAHPFGHRGAFHAPALYAAFAAVLCLPLRGSRPLVFACLFGSMLSHSLLDMMTDGGLGVAIAWPASSERFFLPWRPIPVSPLSVRAFLGEWGLRVLRVEVLFAVPALALSLAARRAGRRRSRASPAPDAG